MTARREVDTGNDTSADLIFQHTTTGQTIYRAIDNGAATGWGNVFDALGGNGWWCDGEEDTVLGSCCTMIGPASRPSPTGTTKMVTLTVNSSRDYRGDVLSDITEIHWTNNWFVTFAPDQFDGEQIATNVHLRTSMTTILEMKVVWSSPTGFSAAGWTFGFWPSNARIVFQGSAGGDLVAGSLKHDFFYVSGADNLFGGDGNDAFLWHLASDLTSGTSINGGAGFDRLLFSRSFDFSAVTLSNMEGISFESGAGAAVTFTSGQIAGMTHVAGYHRFDPIFQEHSYGGSERLIVNGSSVNLSHLVFTNWIPGSDIVTINGTAGADTLIGSTESDTIIGGNGVDTVAWTNSRQNFRVQTKIVDGTSNTIVLDEAGGAETDTLSGIEMLQYSDGTIGLYRAQQNRTSNVDGERFDDVVYRSVSNGQVIFQDMNSGAAAGFDAITNALAAQWKAIGTGDVTGDGKADVFIWNSANGQVLTASPGASGAPVYAVIATGISGAFAAVGAGDINGDGYTDLIVRNSSTGVILWRAMVEGAPADWSTVGNFGSAWSYQGTGDVNRDGFADVAIRSAAGQVVLVNMANETPSGFIDLGNVVGFRAGAIADLNGDGFDDVVLQNETNGQVVWRNLSGAGPAWNVATDAMGTQWALRGAADVDNDRSADLIFQHTTTGQTIYRAMDNGAATGWGNVSDALGGDWVVV
jgi:hypothetical protein